MGASTDRSGQKTHKIGVEVARCMLMENAMKQGWRVVTASWTRTPDWCGVNAFMTVAIIRKRSGQASSFSSN